MPVQSTICPVVSSFVVLLDINNMRSAGWKVIWAQKSQEDLRTCHATFPYRYKLLHCSESHPAHQAHAGVWYRHTNTRWDECVWHAALSTSSNRMTLCALAGLWFIKVTSGIGLLTPSLHVHFHTVTTSPPTTNNKGACLIPLLRHWKPTLDRKQMYSGHIHTHTH